MGKEKALVIKSTGSWYSVCRENKDIVECRIRGKFRMSGIRTTNPVAVGDFVTIEESNDGYVITAIEPRRNYIIRRSTNLSKESHIIASNVDLALLIASVTKPETSTVFIDRFLVTAEAYDIPAVVVFNKTDIYTSDEMELCNAYMCMYRQIGYQCYAVSAKMEEGIEDLRILLQGKMTVVSGISGVGKSTLINRIEPSLHLKTADISELHDTGKHTTTFAEMFPLTLGGSIIDTPGVRSFGLIDISKDELSHYFPEIFKKSEACKFNNCTHTHEPGCAVINAVETGEISETRYWSYRNILDDKEEEKYRQG